MFTQTFAVNATAMSRVLEDLPAQPTMLTKSYYTDPLRETGHPLGIGWNKVESVRGWMRVSGLIAQAPRSRAGEWTLTPLGELVATYDRSLRRQATWWLIHIQLVTNNKDATVYHLLFSECTRHPFSRAEAISHIAAHKESDALTSVDSDVQGIISSWDPGASKLARLGVLVKDGDRFVHGAPEGLTVGMFAYGLYVIRERYHVAAPSMALHVLVDRPGGLRSMFGLDTHALRGPLRQVARDLGPGHAFAETAGLDSVVFGPHESLELAKRIYKGDLHDEITV